MSDVLIVGAAGFTGSNFANYMMQHTLLSVASMDNLSTGNLDNLAPAQAAKNRHKFYLADVRCENINKEILRLESPSTIIYNCFTGNVEEDSKNMRVFFADVNKDTRIITLLSSDLKGAYEEEVIANLTGFTNTIIVKACEMLGPRQGEGFFAREVLSALSGKENTSPLIEEEEEWMYIKDYFTNVISVIDSEPGTQVLEVHSGQWAKRKDIREHINTLLSPQDLCVFMSITNKEPAPGLNSRQYDLEKAMSHTLVWYSKNGWSWN